MEKNPIRSHLDKLTEKDWADVYARVLDFATKRCRDKKSNARAKDLTQDAITRVFAYDSKWDPTKEPDLARYLMSVVNSLLANERHSAAGQRNVSLSSARQRDIIAAHRVSDGRPHAEALLVEADLFSRRLALLEERLAGDPEALEWISHTKNGADTPADIRRLTRWTAETVMTVRRRVLRAAALVARDIGGAPDDDERRSSTNDDEDEEAEEEAVL